MRSLRDEQVVSTAPVVPTPDGREGWLTLFLREGFVVYGVDRPNTGRSGTDICSINAVRLGRAPASELRKLAEPILAKQRPDGGFYQNFWINGQP